MQCPTCQIENRPNALFCDQCATPLARICPYCGNRARPVALYCDQCGHALPGQPAAAPPAARPFSERPLPERAAPGALSSRSAPTPTAPGVDTALSRYIPKELRDKLDVARAQGDMVGERRVVTMLFCDVKGSTAAAEQLDPEEWADIINGAFEHMIRPVYEYEGTVARLMGDAILAFFGAPIAHEDDPQRAVLAGMQIITAIQPYRERVQQEWGIDFSVRVGINTGRVVVGEMGSDLRLEYTAMGDAINLAARMEQTAASNTVQIADPTYRLVAPLFEVETLGAIAVKGKAEPVPAYRVLGRRRAQTQQRGVPGLQAPLIGRGKEQKALRAALDRLTQGVGGIICLIGDAGLGKSRLVRDLKGYADNLPTPPAWRATASLSYETGQPYALFQRWLRRILEVTPAMPSTELNERLDEFMGRLQVPAPPTMRTALAGLLGLDQSLEGEAFRQALLSAMAALGQNHAANPSVLVFDDLHWSDTASVALLQHMLPLVAEWPLLFICVMRPERSAPAWQIQEDLTRDLAHHTTSLTLSPLSAADSDKLIGALLAVADLPGDLRQRIMDRSGGNPFFIEEIIRGLIEDDVLVMVPPEDSEDGRRHWYATRQDAELTVPGSLQALLMARIDRLPEAVRRTLQRAAVIGRTFSWPVLKAIAGDPDDPEGVALMDCLAVLLQRQIIAETSRQPERMYVFRHILTQESAYESLLRKHRRAIHNQIGETLTQSYPDQLDDLAPIVAYHFAAARQSEQAITYYHRAADNAYRVYAYKEAIDHYGAAIDLARQQRPLAETLLKHLMSRRGRALELSFQHQAALEFYEDMAELAELAEAPNFKLAALLAQSTIQSVGSSVFNLEAAIAATEQARALAHELGDSAQEAQVLWNLMLIYLWGKAEPAQAAVIGEQAREIAERHELEERLGIVLNDLGVAYAMTGQPADALDRFAAARAALTRSGNRPVLGNCMMSAGNQLRLTGRLDEARQFMEEGHAIAGEVGDIWAQVYSMPCLMQVYLGQGELSLAADILPDTAPNYPGEGEDPLYQGSIGHIFALILWQLNLGEHTSVNDMQAWYDRLLAQDVPSMFAIERMKAAMQQYLAYLHLQAGNLTQARALVVDARTFDPSFTYWYTILELPFIVTDASIALAEGRPEHALTLLDGLDARYAQYDLPLFRLPLLQARAEAYLALKRLDEAVAVLSEARGLAEAFGDRKSLWPLLALLAQVATAAGRPVEAESWRRQAQQITDAIAATAPNADVRARYLGQPAVRALQTETGSAS